MTEKEIVNYFIDSICNLKDNYLLDYTTIYLLVELVN